MKIRATAALLVLTLVSGCATAPERVAPVSAAAGLYSGSTCQSLDAEKARLDTAYQDAARRQIRTRRFDAVGLVLVGLPVASLTGSSQTKTIGAIKGQQEALSEAYRVSHCGA